MSPEADYVRVSPAARLARSLRGISLDAGLWWLVKRLVSYSSARKLRRTQTIDPSHWRAMWEDRDLAAWPTMPISGIVKLGGLEFAIDRADLAPDGHLWIDGWSAAPIDASIKVDADGCQVLWQSLFRTQRRDVIEARKLSASGTEANIGFQILGKIADYSPAEGRLALIVEAPPGNRFAVPVVARQERSATFWHSLYESVRFHGPRTVDYLRVSVKVLSELRKADWRERSRAVRQVMEDQMPVRQALKVLLMSRHQPNAAYVNLIQLSALLDHSADIIVCSIGQPAGNRANEFKTHLDELYGHTVRFVTADTGTPSSEIIEQFLASCGQRQAAALIVYDDIAIAGAAGSVADAVSKMSDAGAGGVLWRRQAPGIDAADVRFVRPPTSPDDLGPYWTMARHMTHGAFGGALIPPGRRELRSVPPFEGRGFALEYLAQADLKDAAVASAPMLDLVESNGQGEGLTLDMLMLLSD